MNTMFYFTAVVLLLSSVIYGLGPCPHRWTHNEGECYFLGNEKLRFSEAAQVCREMKSELLRINNVAEEQFVSNHFLSTLKSDLWTCGIGSNDKWKCVVDNTTMSYLNWAQSRVPATDSGESCISVSFEKSGMMVEAPCITKQRFLCEKHVASDDISVKKQPGTTGERKTRASAAAMSSAYGASLTQMALSMSAAHAFDNGQMGGAFGFSLNTQIGADGSRSISSGISTNFGGGGLAPHVSQNSFSQSSGPYKFLGRRSVEADIIDENDLEKIEASLSDIVKMLEVSQDVTDIANGDISESEVERDYSDPSSYYPSAYSPYSPYSQYSPYSSPYSPPYSPYSPPYSPYSPYSQYSPDSSYSPYSQYSPYSPYSPYSSYYPSSYSPQLSSAQTQAMSLTPTGQSLSLSGAHGLDLGVVGLSLAYSTNYAGNPRSSAFNTNFGVNVGSPLFPKISFGTSANNANTQGRKRRESDSKQLDEEDEQMSVHDSRLPMPGHSNGLTKMQGRPTVPVMHNLGRPFEGSANSMANSEPNGGAGASMANINASGDLLFS